MSLRGGAERGPDFQIAWGAMEVGAPAHAAVARVGVKYQSLQRVDIYGDDRELFGQMRPRPPGL
jgi:hypothetical protein